MTNDASRRLYGSPYSPEEESIMLPYYARNRTYVDITPPEVNIVLYWPKVRKIFGHVPKRNINTLRSNLRNNLIRGIAFIEYKAEDRQMAYSQFRQIVETYHELLCLAADVGLTQRLYNVHSRSFDCMQEGQNDLFNSDAIVEKLKTADKEERFRALIDKYHAQHEGNLRYTITPAILALDVISGHQDLKSKSDKDYCGDNLDLPP